MKRLYRSENNRIVAGIFGGLGDYFEIDPVILRFIWVVVWVFTAFVPGFLAYFFAYLIVPPKPKST